MEWRHGLWRNRKLSNCMPFRWNAYKRLLGWQWDRKRNVNILEESREPPIEEQLQQGSCSSLASSRECQAIGHRSRFWGADLEGGGISENLERPHAGSTSSTSICPRSRWSDLSQWWSVIHQSHLPSSGSMIVENLDLAQRPVWTREFRGGGVCVACVHAWACLHACMNVRVILPYSPTTVTICLVLWFCIHFPPAMLPSEWLACLRTTVVCWMKSLFEWTSHWCTRS